MQPAEEPAYYACQKFDEFEGFITVQQAISPAHLYTMSELNLTGQPLIDGVVSLGACAQGDILYIQHTGSSDADACVVVMRVTPAQVHVAEIRGRGVFRTEEEAEPVMGHGPHPLPPPTEWVRRLAWIPDAASIAGPVQIFRWSTARARYSNGNKFLTRCYGFPRSRGVVLGDNVR